MIERRTPLVRRTPLAPGGPIQRDTALPKQGRSKMPPISRKRAQQARRYTVLRRDYLAANPLCESPWPCGQRATEVHHRKGRRGELLLDVEWFAASCTECNVVKAEQTHKAESRRLNWCVDKAFTGDPSERPILTAVTAC